MQKGRNANCACGDNAIARRLPGGLIPDDDRLYRDWMLTSPRCHRGAQAAHLEGELPEQDKSGVVPIPDMIKVISCAWLATAYYLNERGACCRGPAL